METKKAIRIQKINLNELMYNVEVLTPKQLKQVRGGENEPFEPVKR
jgi:hypothetical protein